MATNSNVTVKVYGEAVSSYAWPIASGISVQKAYVEVIGSSTAAVVGPPPPVNANVTTKVYGEVIAPHVFAADVQVNKVYLEIIGTRTSYRTLQQMIWT